MNSELISIPKYAAKNRLSIHTVIKKTMNGELPTLVKNEDGKEVTYIILSESKQPLSASEPSESFDEIDYKKEYEQLHRDYLLLKTKYEKLLEQQGNG
ncbi:hypothetical protein [Sulfuricurvum sp.]|uniref:hypothetical protein n=1 Tax=Sulfuricurvum sp. TaxID=2025608 RepID=UPI00262203AB|nr:hypothetical protein [Sulfuricurvum sp.]MDD2266214.1 hypothetical protein [Sulfuricurvum sp.]MDD2783148.1 hypothetical protein [Sulfuricurvum sp.]